MFFKSTRQVCNHRYLNLIKTALKALIFFKNLIFAFLNPKIVKVIENSSKTPLNVSSLQYTHLGKNSVQFYLDLVRKKKKLKSGYFELRFSVYALLLMLSFFVTNAEYVYCT